MDSYDIVIIGSGPAGMGAAFEIAQRNKNLSILMLDRESFSTGGMRNDCKMNFTYPIGFPEEYWDEEVSEEYLEKVEDIAIDEKVNLSVNLTGHVLMNHSAAFTDFHATGDNKAANCALSNDNFVNILDILLINH